MISSFTGSGGPAPAIARPAGRARRSAREARRGARARDRARAVRVAGPPSTHSASAAPSRTCRPGATLAPGPRPRESMSRCRSRSARCGRGSGRTAPRRAAGRRPTMRLCGAKPTRSRSSGTHDAAIVAGRIDVARAQRLLDALRRPPAVAPGSGDGERGRRDVGREDPAPAERSTRTPRRRAARASTAPRRSRRPRSRRGSRRSRPRAPAPPAPCQSIDSSCRRSRRNDVSLIVTSSISVASHRGP